MVFTDYVKTDTINGKFICCGNFHSEGRCIATKGFKAHYPIAGSTVDVLVPKKEKQYLVYIFPTMLSAVGGAFDDEDTIFADIYSIDGVRRDSSNGYGGVWDYHFGSYGAVENMGISAYVGYVQESIRFRIFIRGDDWVGASFVVMEL